MKNLALAISALSLIGCAGFEEHRVVKVLACDKYYSINTSVRGVGLSGASTCNYLTDKGFIIATHLEPVNGVVKGWSH